MSTTRRASISALVRIYFKHRTPEQVVSYICAAGPDGNAVVCSLIENNYEGFVSVVRAVYRRWTFGFKTAAAFMISIDDCTNIAAECLLKHFSPKIRLTASAGEMVTGMCMWIEQKVKRAVLKEKFHAEGLEIKKVRPCDRLNNLDNEKPYVKIYRRSFVPDFFWERLI